MFRQFLLLSLVEGFYRLGQVFIAAAVARIIGPAGYGLIATMQAFTNYASIVADGGTGLYGMHKAAEGKKKGAIQTDVISQIITARIVLASGVYLGLILIALFWVEGVQSTVLMLSGLVVLAVALRLDWLAKGVSNSRLLALPNMIAVGAGLGFLLLFVNGPASLYAAALVPVVSVVVSGMVLFILVRSRMPGVLGVDCQSAAIYEVIRKSFPAAAGTLAQGGSHLVPLFFLGAIGLEELGYFNAAYNLVFPLAALAIYFMNSAIAHIHLDDVDPLQRIGRVIALAAGFGVAVGSGVAFIAPMAVHYLYGDAYATSERVMQVLAIALAIQFVRHMLRGMAVVKGANIRHELSSGMSATILSLVVCIAVVGEYGAVGAAIAVCAGELAGTLLAWWLLHRSCQREVIDG